ncbi:MAG: TetR/AcrR family transcriptional regulator [Coriobacteriales bacterium]|jgi:AcrR family transcriptional regulator|nr:TetR/AcrR family transcriptional regulator [Coriobacteriales bacterium]
MDVTFTTKEQILDAFVEMIATLGYENVSMRDIATKVGINPASIYYHFDNKGQLLEQAYDYYVQHRYDNRKSVAEMKTLIETASAEEIIYGFRYSHESDAPRQYIRMVLISKIVYMRLYLDPIANALFMELNADSAEFISSVLRYGVEIGRIDPDFDVDIFTEVFTGSIQIMGIRAFANPNYSIQQLDQEFRILNQFVTLLGLAMK